MERLKGLFLQMDAKNNNWPFSAEEGGRNSNKPAGRADFTSCSFHYCFNTERRQPAAANHLTACGDLDKPT